MPSQSVEADRLKAFLRLLQYAENARHEASDPYHTLYGGGHFADLSTHPNHAVTRWGHTSKAAGAYFITADTYFDAVRRGVAYDFSPASQDAIALDIINRCGATSYIEDGNFDAAYSLLNRKWSSLPGGSQQEITAVEAETYMSQQLRH